MRLTLLDHFLQVAEGFEEVVKVQLRIDSAGLSDEHLQLVSSFL
jgi:hypothetical protein